MTGKIILKSLLKKIDSALEIENDEFNKLITYITSSKRVFVIGAGRSGLVARAFVMRLVQMGLTAYAVGSVETPAISDKDLLIAISGSGETHFTVYSANAAKERNAKVVTITAKKHASLSKMSDHVIKIHSKTKLQKGSFLLGTVFEDSTLLFFEILIEMLSKKLKITERQMMARHDIFE